MESQTFVYGRDTRTARELLDAAVRLGYPAHVVRATESGFYVPDRVWDAVAKVLSAPAASEAF